MTRLMPMLVSAMFLPLSLFAQDNTANTPRDQAKDPMETGAGSASSVQSVSSDVGTFTNADASAVPQQKSPSQQKPKPSRPSTENTVRPPLEGSMVGYIDNAIVGSQIRLRIDAGFDDNRPDRAEFFYPQCGCNGGTAPGPKPGLVTHLNFQQLYMRAEYAPVRRFSAFFELPVRWVQPQQFVPKTIPNGGFPNEAGIADVQAGLKFAALASPEHYLTFQFFADFPSGDSSKGLGTNHYSIGPSLLFFQKVTDRFSFEAEVGDIHPINGSSITLATGRKGFEGDVFNYGFGPSYELYRGERVRVAPVIELVGWRVLGGLETNGDLLAVVSSDGVNIVNLKFGVRTSIGDHNSVYAGFGQAVTHELWYKHIVRVEYRYSF